MEWLLLEQQGVIVTILDVSSCSHGRIEYQKSACNTLEVLCKFSVPCLGMVEDTSVPKLHILSSAQDFY